MPSQRHRTSTRMLPSANQFIEECRKACPLETHQHHHQHHQSQASNRHGLSRDHFADRRVARRCRGCLILMRRNGQDHCANHARNQLGNKSGQERVTDRNREVRTWNMKGIPRVVNVGAFGTTRSIIDKALVFMELGSRIDL